MLQLYGDNNPDILCVLDFIEPVVKQTKRFGSSSSNVFLHNAIKKSLSKGLRVAYIHCDSVEKKLNTLSDRHFNKLKKEVYETINEVKPKYILSLGGLSLWILLEERLQLHNYVCAFERKQFDYGSAEIHVLDFNPSSMKHMADKNRFLFTLNYVSKNMQKKHLFTDDIKPEIIETVDRFDVVMNAVKKTSIIGFDTEYNPKNNKLLCIGLGISDSECIAVIQDVCHDKHFIERLKEVFISSDYNISAHNWKFDAHVCRKVYGFDERIFTNKVWYDSSVLRKIYNPEQDVALEIAERMIGLGGHKEKLYSVLGTSHNGNAYEKAYEKDPYTVLWYCAIDALATRNLSLLYLDLLKQVDFEEQWKEVMGKLGPCLYAMECQGFKLDRKAQRDLDAYLDNAVALELHAIRKDTVVNRVKINSELIDGEFNPNSARHMQELLFSKYGFNEEATKKTAKGALSVDKDVRNALVEKHPILKHINEFSRLSKLKNTYVKGWKRRADKDWFLHPDFRQDVARTGRLSCKNPNLQNIPNNKTEETLRVRSTLVAHNEDESILEVDFSQAELRQGARESGDKELIDAYLNRVDVHRKTAANMSGCRIDDVTKEQRHRAKPINFGVLYGMGEKKLQHESKTKYDVEMTLAEAKSYIRSFFKLYKGFSLYQKKLLFHAKRNGYIEVNYCNKPMYRRDLVNINSGSFGLRGEDERKALNTPIQGGAMQYVFRGMIKLFEMIQKKELPYVIGMIGMVHDSIIFRVRRGKEKEAFQAIGKVLVSFPTVYDVPHEVDAKYGYSLGNTKEIGSINSLDNVKFPAKKKKIYFRLAKKKLTTNKTVLRLPKTEKAATNEIQNPKQIRIKF